MKKNRKGVRRWNNNFLLSEKLDFLRLNKLSIYIYIECYNFLIFRPCVEWLFSGYDKMRSEKDTLDPIRAF